MDFGKKTFGILRFSHDEKIIRLDGYSDEWLNSLRNLRQQMKLPSTWYARATLRSVSSGRRVAIFDAVYEVPEALLRFSFKDKSHPFEKATESELEQHSIAFLKSNAAWFARHHLKSLPDNFHVEFDDTLHEHAFPLGGKKEKPTAVSASGVKIWLKGERYLE